MFSGHSMKTCKQVLLFHSRSFGLGVVRQVAAALIPSVEEADLLVCSRCSSVGANLIFPLQTPRKANEQLQHKPLGPDFVPGVPELCLYRSSRPSLIFNSTVKGRNVRGGNVEPRLRHHPESVGQRPNKIRACGHLRGPEEPLRNQAENC